MSGGNRPRRTEPSDPDHGIVACIDEPYPQSPVIPTGCRLVAVDRLARYDPVSSVRPL